MSTLINWIPFLEWNKKVVNMAKLKARMAMLTDLPLLLLLPQLMHTVAKKHKLTSNIV